MNSIIFSGYIVGVDRKRITIRVDEEYVDKVAAHKTYISKRHETGNFITINASKSAYKINPRIEWSEIKDLIGIHVRATVESKSINIKKSKVIDNSTSTTSDLDKRPKKQTCTNFYYDIISHRASHIISID